MKTLKGYEAISVATDNQSTLYDLYYKNEISVEQARQFIHSQRDPQSFVLRNWPDSNQEAEEFVLHLFELALVERRLLNARVMELSDAFDDDEPIHKSAVDLAAQRLADANRLQIVELHRGANVYRLPATICLTDAFLTQLRGVVCDECANLDLDGPFHKSCLTSLVEFVESANFRLRDITEVRTAEPESSIRQMVQRRVPVEFLNKTISDAKSHWQSVLKPMFQKANNYGRKAPEGAVFQDTAADENASKRPGTAAQGNTPSNRTAPEALQGRMSSTPSLDKERITKEQLISYLGQVEIVDETGELRELRNERVALVHQIDAKDKELAHIERQRAFLEQQCEEMKRDLDTLIQAMQISKRRGYDASNVVDVEAEADRR